MLLQYYFCALRHFAHRAFWAAAIFLRAAGDIVRPLRAVIETTLPFAFAQRARCAAAIRARPAVEILLLPVLLLPTPFSAEIALLRRSS